MEKIFQILSVFGLLMLAITYFIRGRDEGYRKYVFAGRFTFPLYPEGTHPGQLLSAIVRSMPTGGLPVAGAVHPIEEGAEVEDDAFSGQPEQAETLLGEANVVLFDPGTRLIYCYNLNGRITVMLQSNRDSYKIMQELSVPPEAAQISLDPGNGKLYVQAGNFVSVYHPS